VINTAAPSEIWRIYTSSSSGALRFYSDDNGGSPTVWFDDATGAYNQISDRRFKKNIQSCGQVLPDILALEAKKYHYNNQDDQSKLSFGFIAQEVQEHFPELVSMEDDRYGLNYDGFGVLAIKAIQEQQDMIEMQKQQIELQSQQMDSMREELDIVKSQLNLLLSKAETSTTEIQSESTQK
jgi:hypothetical protein